MKRSRNYQPGKGRKAGQVMRESTEGPRATGTPGHLTTTGAWTLSYGRINKARRWHPRGPSGAGRGEADVECGRGRKKGSDREVVVGGCREEMGGGCYG